MMAGAAGIVFAIVGIILFVFALYMVLYLFKTIQDVRDKQMWKRIRESVAATSGIDGDRVRSMETSAIAPSGIDRDRIRPMESTSAAHRSGIRRVVPPGVPQAEIINSLPLVRYSKTGAYLPTTSMNDNVSECPVCLNVYEEAERIRFLPNCGNVFHSACINTWLQSHPTCPLCRTNVEGCLTSNQTSLRRISSLFRRSGGNEMTDSSEDGRQSVSIDVTPPPQQHNSIRNTGNPLLPISHPHSSREVPEEQAPESSVVSSTSSNTLEPGMIFLSVWGSYLSVPNSRPSSSSSTLVSESIHVTATGSEQSCNSAGTGFVTISLDTNQPER